MGKDLATKRTESEGVEETSVAYFTSVDDTLPLPRLRSLIEEDDLRTVDHVRLHTRNVQHLLDFIHSDHIMIGRSPNLQHQPIMIFRYKIQSGTGKTEIPRTEDTNLDCSVAFVGRKTERT